MPDANNKSWREFLLSHATDDLLTVAEKGRLYFKQQPIRLHWLDQVSLLLIRRAYLRKQPLAICYPIPVCRLPTLAAAQLLLYDFALAHRTGIPVSRSIVLISPRIEVRQNYLQLQAGRYRVDRIRLAEFLPLARIRDSGDPVVISVPGRPLSKRPRLYHLSRSHLLDAPWPRDVGAIIVDHAGGRFDEETPHIHAQAARRGISTVIHLCTDPFAPFLEELAATGVPVWIWDHNGLAADFGEQIATGNGATGHPFGVSARQFQNIAAGIRHHTLVCKCRVLEDAAHSVWDDLGAVQRTFSDRTSLGVRRAIRIAYGTFYTMLQMLVPLPVYEEEARNMWGIRPVSRRIDDLEAFTPLLRDEAPNLVEVYWPSLIMDLKEMRDALAAGNPKYDTLVQQIHEHLDQKRNLTIVCPNQATRRMLQLCLRAREGLHMSALLEENNKPIRLVTYKELGDLDSCDVMLFPGQFSYGRRQYALTAATPEIRYLAYGDEADRIEQQVATIHQTLAEMTSTEKRQRAWAALAPSRSDRQLPETASAVTVPAIEFIRREGERVSYRSVTAARAPDLSLWTPFSTSEYDLDRGQDVLSSDREEALRPSEFVAPWRQNVLVPALRIEFADGLCYAEPDSRMTVFLPATDKTDDRSADGLRPEDVVIFVDGDQRRHMYEAILERIEHHPAMGATYILVRYWQQAVREGFFRSGMTYGDFLHALEQLGSHMQTTAGVRCWVTGEVLGPGGARDIWRVGKVFNDEALTQEWKEIDKALRRVRGLHISLARKLNQMIVQAGLKGRRRDVSEECIDPELNLYLDDFRDSVTMHRVTAINPETTPVPYVMTGRFFEKGMELKW